MMFAMTGKLRGCDDGKDCGWGWLKRVIRSGTMVEFRILGRSRKWVEGLDDGNAWRWYTLTNKE